MQWRVLAYHLVYINNDDIYHHDILDDDTPGNYTCICSSQLQCTGHFLHCTGHYISMIHSDFFFN